MANLVEVSSSGMPFGKAKDALESNGQGLGEMGIAVAAGEEEVRSAYSDDTGPQNKWYHVSAHLTTVIIGTGVLGLPGAMSYLTWVPGIVLLTLAFFGSYYTARLLGLMHHTRGPEKRKRLNTYFAIGEYVLGSKRRAQWLVNSFQVIVLSGTAIAYLIAAGSQSSDIYTSNCSNCTNVKVLVWTSIFALLQIGLCFFRTLETITGVSVIAAVCSLGYCVIAIGLSLYVGQQPNVSYGVDPDGGASTVFNIFTGLSTMAFALGAHMMMPEIQATLRPDPAPEKEFLKALSVSWVLTFVLYYGSAIAGYWAFGRDVQSNILSSIVAVDNSGTVKGLVIFAEVLVIIHVVIAYQVLAQPVYAIIENAIFSQKPQLLNRSVWTVRGPVRIAFVGITYFIAILIPFFGDIMSLFGAIGMTPLTFVLPCLFYLMYMGNSISTRSKYACWIIFTASVIVGVAGMISAIRQIILDADEFSLFM